MYILDKRFVPQFAEWVGECYGVSVRPFDTPRQGIHLKMLIGETFVVIRDVGDATGAVELYSRDEKFAREMYEAFNVCLEAAITELVETDENGNGSNKETDVDSPVDGS